MTGKAPERHLVAYIVAGALLTMTGRLLVSWVGIGYIDADTDLGDLLRAVYDPKVDVDPALLTAHQWAAATALLVVGLLTLMHRSAGRGGALLLAFLVCGVAARELVGLAADEDFRLSYFGGTGFGPSIVASWITTLLFGIAVVAVMWRASGPAVPRAQGRPYLVSGVLLLALGVVSVAWIVRMVSLGDGQWVRQYLHGLVDASAPDYPEIAGSAAFFEAAYAVAFLVLGVLALLRRPVARGGAMTLAVILVYLNVRLLAGMTLFSDNITPRTQTSAVMLYAADWDVYTPFWEGRLWLATLIGGTLIASAVFVLMLRAATGPATPSPAPPAEPRSTDADPRSSYRA